MIKGSTSSSGKKPTVPTAATAAAGTNSATVSFTGSSYKGKTNSIVYRAISTPGSLTGTSSTSPVSINGLTNGTSYNFSVRAETPYGVNTGYSATTNSVVPSGSPTPPPTPPTYNTFWFNNLECNVYSFDIDDPRICKMSKPDSSGNVYVTAYASADNIYAEGTFAKYDPDGNLLWQNTLDIPYGNTFATITDIEADSSGNVYICGYGDYPGGGKRYGILAKYDTNGIIVWQKKLKITYGFLGPFPGIHFYGLTLDSSGNIYVCGRVSNDPDASPDLDNNGLIVKYNSSGTVVWQKSFADTTNASDIGCDFRDIKIDSSGNIYVIGYAYTFPISIPNYVGEESQNAFLLKYNSSGSVVWYKRFSAEKTWTNPIVPGNTFNICIFNSLDIDSSDNIYVTGWSFDNLNIDPSVPPDSGVVQKFNSSGVSQWRKTINNVSTNSKNRCALYSVRVDSSGNVFVVGLFIDFISTFVNYAKGIIIKLDNSGNFQWQRELLDTTNNYGAPLQDLTLDSDQNLFVSGGLIYGTVGPLLVAHLPSDGSKTVLTDIGIYNISYGVSTLNSYDKTVNTVVTSPLSNTTSTFTEDTLSISNRDDNFSSITVIL